jgi:hypothetical protein
MGGLPIRMPFDFIKIKVENEVYRVNSGLLPEYKNTKGLSTEEFRILMLNLGNGVEPLGHDGFSDDDGPL